MNTVRRVTAILLLLLVTFQCVAQSVDIDLPEAEPYSEEEFSDFALNLRRAEIVATGTFPLTLLASRLLYGLVRFAVRSIQAGSIAMAYAPAFLSVPGAVPLSRGEKFIILGGAGLLSTTIALIDLRLGREENVEE